jgi:2-polyprenyl-6-methoxyphenol hydroxylase-like FAD-dependent oxidoreductase
MARILVVGGSLGGLMAANMLLRAGHEVQLLERSPRSLQGRGAGIVTHDSLRTALRACGVAVDDTLGVAVQERVVLDATGHTQHRWHCPQVLTSWGRLYALLSQAFPPERLQLGAQLASVSQSEQGVTATLADGRQLQADLLLGADGLRSTVRAQLAPQVQTAYAGYVAWRGVCDEAVLSRLTARTLFGHFGFGLPEREQMIGYPVAGADDSTRPGERRWNFVWYRPAPPAELQALLTDADGLLHAEGIAPQQVSWRAIAAAREAARRLLAPQFAEILEKTAQPFLQPIHDLASTQLAFGRVALLGDAAFVARPHVGMGVTKAGDDALALAACIAQHGAVPAALRAYEAQRLGPCTAVVERGRQLGAYLASQPGTADVPRSAEEVMRATAIDPSSLQIPKPPTSPQTETTA